MDIFRDYSWIPWHEWETLWPLGFPVWSDRIYAPHIAPGTRLLAQERANRRWEKKMMKAARAQGVKKRDRMPGAWPV